MKNSTTCLAVLFLASLVAACGGSDSAPNLSAPSLVSIAVTPAGPFITTGATQQFTATGTYSDSTSTVLTSSVTWSTSDALVSTISSSGGTEGLATAGALGSTTISALYDGVTGSTLLTVATPASLTITTPLCGGFPDVSIGSSFTQTCTVANTGGAPSGTISCSIGGVNPLEFIISSNTCTGVALASLETCTVGITFSPLVAETSRSATLIASATLGGTATLGLSGDGMP